MPSFSTAARLACLALLSGVIAFPLEDGLLDVAFVEETQPLWTFDDLPGGQVIEFNGTVEALYSYVAETYPDQLGNVFDLGIVSQNEENIFAAESKYNYDATLWKRQSRFSGARYSCYGGVKACPVGLIDTGIRYLRGVKGKPTLAAGAKSRVSCSWNAGIWWINTSRGRKTLEGFGSIADGAQYLKHSSRCEKVEEIKQTKPPSIVNYVVVGGIVHHSTQWSVEVKTANC